MKVAKYLALSLIAIALVGCEEDSGNNTPADLKLNSESGKIALSSLMPADNCYAYFGAVDFHKTYRASGSNVTFVWDAYSSTDGSCTGSKSNIYSYTVKFTLNGEVSAGWDTTAPTLADGSAPMSDPATAIKYELEVISSQDNANGVYAVPSVGTITKDIIFVDDSGADPIIYSGDSTVTDADGFPTALQALSAGTIVDIMP